MRIIWRQRAASKNNHMGNFCLTSNTPLGTKQEHRNRSRWIIGFVARHAETSLSETRDAVRCSSPVRRKTVPIQPVQINFDTDAKLAEWYCNTADSGGAIAAVRRVVESGVSCAEIMIGSEIPTAVFLTDATSGGYAKMTANLNYAAGAVANCYDEDSSKHGRYVKVGASGTGSWGTRTGSVTPAMWTDENHRRVGQLNLLFESWSKALDPFAGADGPGGITDKLGYPDIRDLRGVTMRWRLRAQNMEMGPNTKIVQHFQTRVPRIPTSPTTSPVVNAPAFVNSINTATCISDKLGFGTGGVFARNTVDFVADSGWVDVDIPLLADETKWLALGGLPNKQGRQPFSQSLKYVCAPVNEWLPNWTGNAYMVGFYPNPNPGTDMAPPAVADQIKGRLLIQSLGFSGGI
jgi:hypothetical protein